MRIKSHFENLKLLIYLLIFCSFASCTDTVSHNSANEGKVETRVMFKVESDATIQSKKEEVGFVSSSEKYFRKLFTTNSLNQCVDENCEFCCLSNYFCGSKDQCENSKGTMVLFKFVFYTFGSVLVVLLLIKIYLSDSENEQKDSDKIDTKTANSLVNIMMANKDFKDKFKT